MNDLDTTDDFPAPTLDPKRRYLCRHIHASGERCGSPALRGRSFCYYHGTARDGFPASGRLRTGQSFFKFQPIDTRADIQLALFDVLSRIAASDIDTKRASILLYGLQIASSNLPRPKHEHQPAQPIEQVDYSYHFGDIAPIQELPTTPETPEAVILTEAAHAVSSALEGPASPTAVILSDPEQRERESKDPERSNPTPTDNTFQPPESETVILSEAAHTVSSAVEGPASPTYDCHPERAQRVEGPASTTPATPTEPSSPSHDQPSTINHQLTLCAAAAPWTNPDLTLYSEILCTKCTGGGGDLRT